MKLSAEKNAAILAAVERTIAEHGGKVKRVEKGRSLFMRLLSIPLYLFNREFMTSFVTTIPFLGKAYVPKGWFPVKLWRTMAHEGMHSIQAKKEGQLRFALKYTFPQVFALLALFAIGAIWWTPMLFSLVFLLALLPWPAPYRAEYELEAYWISWMIDAVMGQDVYSKNYVEYALSPFIGWNYYRPMWRRKSIEKDVRAHLLAAQYMGENPHEFDGEKGYLSQVMSTIVAELERKP